jgi:predicted DNA-binding protein (MmcQ/YjbR family)
MPTARPRAKPVPKSRATGPRPLPRLRKLCLALPEAHEVEAWGEPTFRVRNKLFAMYAAPRRFFVPPYVGPSGWVGVWLDGAVDWAELADLLRDSYRLVAPKRLRLP